MLTVLAITPRRFRGSALGSRSLAMTAVGDPRSVTFASQVMKLPADGSALVNSVTVKASSATASAAARIVSGAATPAVAATTPNPK